MRPDAVVLVDYPGFNLKLARFAKELGIKVFLLYRAKALGLEGISHQAVAPLCRLHFLDTSV